MPKKQHASAADRAKRERTRREMQNAKRKVAIVDDLRLRSTLTQARAVLQGKPVVDRHTEENSNITEENNNATCED
jgi:hypothetical protein